MGAPAIGDPNQDGADEILVGTSASGLYSIDLVGIVIDYRFAADGAITGAPAIGDPNTVNGIQIGDPSIFVGTGAGTIYGIVIVDGRPEAAWSMSLPGPIRVSPALANGVLYTANQQRGRIIIICFVALEASSGRMLLDARYKSGISPSPIVADGRAIFGSDDGKVHEMQISGHGA